MSSSGAPGSAGSLQGSTLLLDLDGTLVDPAHGTVAAVTVALEALGRAAPPADDLDWVIGPPLRRSFETLLGGPDRVEDAMVLYRAEYARTGIFDARPYEGIHAALEMLAGTYRLLLCTSKALPFARQVVARFGFAPHLDRLYGAELDGRFDDKGDLIAHILEHEGLDPPRTVMIGDRVNDTEAASRNGVACIGVLWGYGDANELAAGGATRLCATPADLPACVAAVLNGKSR